MQLPPDLLLLIDRYGDGELSPAETASFEARLAGDSVLASTVGAALDDRERFRIAVAHAMAGSSGDVARAPSELRASVAEALAAEVVQERVSRLAANHRAAGLWSAATPTAPRFARVNYGAVAASLALVAGAVIFGIFGPRVAERPPLPGNVSVAEVAARLMSEYAACSAAGTCSGQGQPWRSREEAQMELTRLLNRPVIVPDLEAAGFVFCSGGPSCVPGACERSAQLLYCRLDDSGDRCQWLSVHVVPVETPYLAYDPFGRSGPLQCGIDYSLITSTGGEMHYWCDGVLTWFVTPGSEIEFDALRRAFPA